MTAPPSRPRRRAERVVSALSVVSVVVLAVMVSHHVVRRAWHAEDSAALIGLTAGVSVALAALFGALRIHRAVASARWRWLAILVAIAVGAALSSFLAFAAYLAALAYPVNHFAN